MMINGQPDEAWHLDDIERLIRRGRVISGTMYFDPYDWQTIMTHWPKHDLVWVPWLPGDPPGRHTYPTDELLPELMVPEGL